MRLKLRYLVLPGLVLGAALAFSVANTSAQSAPSPTAGKKLAGDLISPRGMKIGPDGMIYVAEAGSGGDIAPPAPEAGKVGLTGRISKIDPATGARTTVADKLPSHATEHGDAVGPADVAFLGGKLYYVQTHGGTAYGFPDNPTGVYRVNKDGTVTLFADIGTFNIDNPIADVKSKVQADIEVGGNPYSMIERGGDLYVADGNQNQIMKINSSGKISRLSEFTGHPVTTGIASAGNSGPLYVAGLGQGPFLPSDGRVFQVGFHTGVQTKIANGFSSMTDVEVGPGGQLYALSFGDFAPGPDGPPWMLGSAKVFKVDAASGTLIPITTGFSLSTALIFSGDTAYVTNYGVSFPGAPGEIWKIDNVSSLAALPRPEPTKVAAPPAPTPRSGIAAPNTGTGGAAGSASWLPALLITSIAGVALVVAGTRTGTGREA